MRYLFIGVVFAVLAPTLRLAAQTTQSVAQPATQSVEDDRLEFRAAMAFDRGDDATALPLLRKLRERLKDRPAKLSVIDYRIKVCEESLAKQPPSPFANRQPHPAPQPDQTLTMTIKELGNFDYDQDKGGNIPDDVKRLSGAKIRLTGFMIPVDQAEHITQFALVPSLFSCCFGQPPQVQHTIVCNCPKGKAVAFTPDPIVVEGTLQVKEERDDGYVTSIFQIIPTSVTLAPKDAKP